MSVEPAIEHDENFLNDVVDVRISYSEAFGVAKYEGDVSRIKLVENRPGGSGCMRCPWARKDSGVGNETVHEAPGFGRWAEIL